MTADYDVDDDGERSDAETIIDSEEVWTQHDFDEIEARLLALEDTFYHF